MGIASEAPYPVGTSPVGGSDAESPSILGAIRSMDDLRSTLRVYQSEAVDAKTAIESRWDLAQKAFDGDWDTHWANFKFEPEWTRQDAHTLNLFRQAVGVTLPILLSSRPTLYVSALNPDQDEASIKIQDYLQGLTEESDLVGDLTKVYRDALVRGFGCMKVFWDNSTFQTATPFGINAYGRPRMCYLNPYSFFVDPNAEKLDDSRYILLRNCLEGDVIEERYGVSKLDYSKMEREDTGKRRRMIGKTPVSTQHDRYFVWECFHEWGRRLTIYSRDEILYDGPNPMPYNKFPVVVFTPEERDEEIYGYSWWDGGGKELHEQINYWLWKINCYMHMVGNPQWLHIGAGTLEPDTKPGGLWRLKNATPQTGDVRPLAVPPFPTFAMSMLQFYIKRWELLTGVTPTLQGAREPGVRSGIQQQQAMAASQTVVENAVGSFAISLAKAGQMLLDLITHNAGGQMSSAQVYGEKARRAQVSGDDLRSFDGTPHEFRVLIGPNTDLPMDQNMINQLTAMLVPMGAVDTEGALSATRYPYRRGILERMRQAALSAHAEAAQQTAAAGIQAQLLAPEMQQGPNPEQSQGDAVNLLGSLMSMQEQPMQ